VRRLPKKFHGLYLCDPFPKDNKVFDNWEFHDMKVVNEQNFTKKGKLVDNPPKLVLFPNYFGIAIMKGSKRELRSSVPILQSTEGQRLNFYFFDEYNRGDVRVRSLISIPLHLYVGIVDGEASILYSLKKLDDSEKYWIKAVRIPMTSVIGGDKLITYRYFVVTSRVFKEDFSDVVDKKFDSFDDLCLVWDFDKNIPVYDEVETFIILSALIFCKSSNPAINLILAGATMSKKTAWFDSFKEIFGDDYAIAQWSSIKGLIMSHYGEQPQAGLLFKATFVSMIDEFFRRFLSDTREVSRQGTLMTLRNGLSDFMNVLEHKSFPFASGKGSMDLILKTSFMATDNVVYKKAIPELWKRDNSVLRRLAWLLVSDDTARRGQSMTLSDFYDIKPKLVRKLKKSGIDSLGQYGKFCKYARKEVAKIELIPEEESYFDELISRAHAKYKTTFFLNPTLKALFVCWKFFRLHMRNLDKEFFERAFWRLLEDTKKILEPDNSGNAGSTHDWKQTFKDTADVDI
jgi:hypothetical protein